MKLKTNQKFPDLEFTRKVLVDGVAYYNINGLYKICKYKKDAEFIYKLILKNHLKPGAPKAYILLDGHELVLKRREVFKLGIPIGDKYKPLENIASKIFKDFDEPEITLKLSGMFLYRYQHKAFPILIPCEESIINNERVPNYYQYYTELFLPRDYLIESSFDGNLLPQSTQLFDLDKMQQSGQENYLFFYTKDIEDIIERHLSFRDRSNFLLFNADREFRYGKEVTTDKLKNKKRDRLGRINSVQPSEASNGSNFKYNVHNQKPSHGPNQTEEIISASKTIKGNFKDTVNSIFSFILSLKNENFKSIDDIFKHLSEKFIGLDNLETMREFLDTENTENFLLSERDIELFTAELILTLKDDVDVKKYKVVDRIYEDYSDFRRNKAWSSSRIASFTNNSYKELSQYLK